MPVPLRTDFDAQALRAIARTTKDGPQARRLLALAAIYDGATRTAAARIGGVTVQIVRDWVVKFNAHGARPRHHAKNEAAVAAFKKTSPPVWRSLRRPRLMAR